MKPQQWCSKMVRKKKSKHHTKIATNASAIIKSRQKYFYRINGNTFILLTISTRDDATPYWILKCLPKVSKRTSDYFNNIEKTTFCYPEKINNDVFRSIFQCMKPVVMRF